MGVDLVADATYDLDGLAGFTGVSVAFTHRVGDRLHSAIITATKPVDADPATTVTARPAGPGYPWPPPTRLLPRPVALA